jgi:hypothetical protein
MAAARHHDRHSVSRKKSDPGDALVPANILRTDIPAHRPLPQDNDLAERSATRPAPPAGRRHLEPPADRRPTAVPAARVLPGRPGSLRAGGQRPVPTQSPRVVQDRPATHRRCEADPHPAPVRPPAQPPTSSPTRRRRRCLTTPTPSWPGRRPFRLNPRTNTARADGDDRPLHTLPAHRGHRRDAPRPAPAPRRALPARLGPQPGVPGPPRPSTPPPRRRSTTCPGCRPGRPPPRPGCGAPPRPSSSPRWSPATGTPASELSRGGW